ncbi:uncharacterized protein LOC108677068 [Hyalella azteca]|uniref:RING-type E3 ubiquitin transferase n=1 Tax=Hyalella azteca TaxID=294128 RepID=A0A8B7P3L4_HYAAZ|nr:uncharacterized protein LOC108677068 [Hyalella azteca]
MNTSEGAVNFSVDKQDSEFVETVSNHLRSKSSLCGEDEDKNDNLDKEIIVAEREIGELESHALTESRSNSEESDSYKSCVSETEDPALTATSNIFLKHETPPPQLKVHHFSKQSMYGNIANRDVLITSKQIKKSQELKIKSEGASSSRLISHKPENHLTKLCTASPNKKVKESAFSTTKYCSAAVNSDMRKGYENQTNETSSLIDSGRLTTYTYDAGTQTEQNYLFSDLTQQEFTEVNKYHSTYHDEMKQNHPTGIAASSALLKSEDKSKIITHNPVQFHAYCNNHSDKTRRSASSAIKYQTICGRTEKSRNKLLTCPQIFPSTSNQQLLTDRGVYPGIKNELQGFGIDRSYNKQENTGVSKVEASNFTSGLCNKTSKITCSDKREGSLTRQDFLLGKCVAASGSSRRLPASDKDEDRQAAGSHLTDARVARDSSAHAVVDLQPKKLYTRQKFDHNCRNDGNRENLNSFFDSNSYKNIHISSGHEKKLLRRNSDLSLSKSGESVTQEINEGTIVSQGKTGVVNPQVFLNEWKDDINLQSDVFETELIVRERKFKGGKVSTLTSKDDINIFTDNDSKSGKPTVVSSTLPVPTAITVGRSASFNDKYLTKSKHESNASSLLRHRCHSSSSQCLSGDYFHFQNFRRFISSPKRHRTGDKMANSSPVGSESSSLSSTMENRKNKTIRQMGTNFVRKISKPSKSEIIFKRTETSEQSGEFRRAIASATAACNGSIGGDPSLIAYEELLKLFLCPGCQMLMSPPLPQCRKGHIVCSQCKLNSKNVCPICKQRYAEGCNVMMEQVYHLLKLPCRFSSHGCTRLIVQAEKTEHEAYCSHRPVSCNYANNGCSEQLPYSLMLEHVKTCDFKTNIIVGVI